MEDRAASFRGTLSKEPRRPQGLRVAVLLGVVVAQTLFIGYLLGSTLSAAPVEGAAPALRRGEMKREILEKLAALAATTAYLKERFDEQFPSNDARKAELARTWCRCTSLQCLRRRSLPGPGVLRGVRAPACEPTARRATHA
jgi:hypothetical protein